MKRRKKLICAGVALLVMFAVFTLLLQTVDVHPAGESKTDLGFATLNGWFQRLTGVHMMIYIVTDWLSLVPVFSCMALAAVGLIQLIKRKSLSKVDFDILLLGIYYVIVIFTYLVFECIPINYRPILINGHPEASYPSSTTLLVLSVMPTVAFQANRRIQNEEIKKAVIVSTIAFSLFMVIGRLVSGVHWFTDIVGSVLLSGGLFCLYYASTLSCCKKEE